MRDFAVMQVIDSLQVGGAESVAVNLANRLSERGVKSFLCTTRADGPQAKRLSSAVGHLSLHRRGFIDAAAVVRLIRFIREHQVDLLHVHGTALSFSSLAKLFVTRLKLLWHDHFGRFATEKRSVWLYGIAARRTSGVIAVNEQLAKWKAIIATDVAGYNNLVKQQEVPMLLLANPEAGK